MIIFHQEEIGSSYLILFNIYKIHGLSKKRAVQLTEWDVQIVHT